MQYEKNLSVALVYPPYGPIGVPNLGIAILSSAIRKLGIRCKTFFWNFDFLNSLPEKDIAGINLYKTLTGRYLHPWNEWPFARWLFAEEILKFEQKALLELNELGKDKYFSSWKLSPMEIIQKISANVQDSIDQIVEKLDGYDIVGINTTYYQNLSALSLAKELKKKRPNTFVVLGGANCHGDMGIALCEFFSWIDAVFIGESDHSFPELVSRFAKNLPYNDIPGIVFRNRDGVNISPTAHPISDLNSIGEPDFDDYVNEFQNHDILKSYPLCLPLESSRGCWWGSKQHCTFCGLNAEGLTYRKKDFLHFSEQVKSVHKKYKNKFFL